RRSNSPQVTRWSPWIWHGASGTRRATASKASAKFQSDIVPPQSHSCWQRREATACRSALSCSAVTEVLPSDAADTVTFPGARRPDRRRVVPSAGLGLAVYEWGDADAPPLLLAHGGFDFAGTFDL